MPWHGELGSYFLHLDITFFVLHQGYIEYTPDSVTERFRKDHGNPDYSGKYIFVPRRET
jgi:hypothetical protein